MTPAATATLSAPAPTREATATPRPAPPPEDGTGLSQVFEQGTSGRREVALTFDAGADRGYAAEILDTLAAYGIKASFGITGHWAEANPDLVKRMVAEGHMVFNHTWSHNSMTGFSQATTAMPRQQRLKELQDTEELIKELTGYDPRPYFRPPYGDYDDSVLADVADAGYYITVMWSCDSLGWNGLSADEVVARCVELAAPGAIILMHVGADSSDAQALPGLIDALSDEGYDLVTVEQLLQP
jgi:peptidoglycan/xylan/chitin deacetylase (PgdA/CDA1 family)